MKSSCVSIVLAALCAFVLLGCGSRVGPEDFEGRWSPVGNNNYRCSDMAWTEPAAAYTGVFDSDPHPQVTIEMGGSGDLVVSELWGCDFDLEVREGVAEALPGQSCSREQEWPVSTEWDAESEVTTLTWTIHTFEIDYNPANDLEMIFEIDGHFSAAGHGTYDDCSMGIESGQMIFMTWLED